MRLGFGAWSLVLVSLRSPLGVPYGAARNGGVGSGECGWCCGGVCVMEFVLPKKILCVMGKRETWKFIIQTLAAILSAIATSFGVASCVSGL